MCIENCDEVFLEKVKDFWEINRQIDAYTFPRLLAIAERCRSVHRVEDENEWLRARMDALTTTNLEAEARTPGQEDKD